MSNNKQVDDIVAKTAEILGTGKGFGGWTDTVEEDAYKRHVKKQHASREREKKEIEAEKKEAEKKKEEPLVIHGPDGTRKNPQYSNFIYPKDVIKKESVEMDEDYIKEKPDGTWCVYDDDGKIVKEFKTKSEAEDFLGEAYGDEEGGYVKPNDLTVARKNSNKKYNIGGFSAPPTGPMRTTEDIEESSIAPDRKGIPNYRKMGRAAGKVARQLLDKKREMLVHNKDGKVTTIDRKDYEQFKKDNPEGGIAEEREQLDEILPLLGMAASAIGRKVVGGLAKKAIGGAVKSIFKPRKAPGEPGKEEVG